MSTTEERYAEAGIRPAAQPEPFTDPEPFAVVEVDPASTRVTHEEDGLPVLHHVEDGEPADDDTSDTDQEA